MGVGKENKKRSMARVSRGSSWVAVRGKGLLGIESLIGSQLKLTPIS